MVFTKRRDNRNVNIKIENQNIEQVGKAKFWGIIIDEQLNWKEHILYISNKISKAIGVIVKARSLGKKDTSIPILKYDLSLSDVLLTDLGSKLYIYVYLYITSYINYKRAIRIICSENRSAHLMKELGVLNMKNIYNYLVGQFMFRYVNNLLPNVLQSYFTLSTSVYSYNILLSRNYTGGQYEKYNYKLANYLQIPFIPLENII